MKINTMKIELGIILLSVATLSASLPLETVQYNHGEPFSPNGERFLELTETVRPKRNSNPQQFRQNRWNDGSLSDLVFDDRFKRDFPEPIESLVEMQDEAEALIPQLDSGAVSEIIREKRGGYGEIDFDVGKKHPSLIPQPSRTVAIPIVEINRSGQQYKNQFYIQIRPEQQQLLKMVQPKIDLAKSSAVIILREKRDTTLSNNQPKIHYIIVDSTHEGLVSPISPVSRRVRYARRSRRESADAKQNERQQEKVPSGDGKVGKPQIWLDYLCSENSQEC